MYTRATVTYMYYCCIIIDVYACKLSQFLRMCTNTYTHVIVHCRSATGAGVGEGDSYQGVHVDDGSAAVGALDYLVPQTVYRVLYLWTLTIHPTEGILHLYTRIHVYIYVYCTYVHVHVRTMHAYIHVHLYTCMYMYMYILSLPLSLSFLPPPPPLPPHPLPPLTPSPSPSPSSSPSPPVPQVGQVFPKTDFLILLIFVTLFIISGICFCFLLRSQSNKLALICKGLHYLTLICMGLH